MPERKTIVISIEFLRKDVADQVFALLPKKSYDNHWTHFTFTLPVFRRMFARLGAKDRAVFLSDSLLFNQMDIPFHKELYNLRSTQHGVDGYEDDRRRNSELLVYKLEQKIQDETTDFIWCHFWSMLHDNSLNGYAENARYLANLIIALIERNPDHDYIITADHGICLDGEYNETRRDIRDGSVHIPLYLTNGTGTYTGLTCHDDLADYLNGTPFGNHTEIKCWYADQEYIVNRDGVITATV